MNDETLRDVVARLSASATALAALGAELSARVTGRPIHESLRPHLDDVLRESGAQQALEAAGAEEIAPLLAELQHFWLIDRELLTRPERAPGWNHEAEDVLETGGDVTAGFAHALARIAPTLDGLAERLERGGRFLDVGTGVGKLSIAVARRWPSLRVVGIDPWSASLARARANVRASELEDRITLREQAGEDLSDQSEFDLAWVPAPFIPAGAMCKLIEKVKGALVPGGWVLVAAAKPGQDLRGATMRLRVATFGGRPSTEAELRALLEGAGFTDVRALPGPPRDFKLVMAARRPA